ncbi:oligosaccharide flippase family protein [Panacibacter sp. DH6]|uniref:Oligosaccharide flippase family protein n=1 Tax=Panacibacter microcysteis TaxID=2793269 RepID=A0A931E1T7_9BACT|nr:oligosaccharide flippase family protein [Panacibacter microcysteis]MBG9375483.1 oligosaccharide flippase family protein [Panacibacter microcysteis]
MQERSASTFKKYLSVKYILSFSLLNYLQSAISLIVSVLLAKELGREEYGYFAYGMVYANTLFIIMQFGTDKTLVRDLVQRDQPEITISSAGWLWFMLGIVIVGMISVWAFGFAGFSSKTAIVVLICSALGFMRGMSPMPWFDYKGKANYHSSILLIDRLIFVAATLLIVFFYKNEQAIISIALAQFLARAITIFLEWKYVASTAKLTLKPVYTEIKTIARDNVWVWLGAMGNLLMTQVNQLMIDGKFGVKELALYGFAFQVIMVIRLLQQQILRLITPTIAVITHNIQTHAKQARKKLLQFCSLNILLSSCIVLPAYFIMPYFIEIVNKDFLGALPVLNVLYVWILLFGVAIIINQFLIGLRLQKFFFISTTVFGLLSLGLAEIFIEEYGSIGAAMSLLIAHSCSVLFQLFIVLRKIKKEANVAHINE